MEAVRPPAEWLSHPDVQAYPQKYMAWELYNGLTRRVQVPWTFGKKWPEEKQTAQFSIVTPAQIKTAE